MRYLNWFGRASFVLALAAIATLACTAAEDKKDRGPDVVYWPTPHKTVEKMLQVANVTKKDIVYDLGCGDGRIVCAAAKKYGCKAYGFDIDPQRIKECAANKAKLDKETQKLVTFKKQDIFAKDFDISEATVVTLYLLRHLNVKLIPKLKTLKDGCRIVSHDFDMEGVTPEKGYPITVKAKRDNGEEHDSEVYLWTTPLKLTKKDKD
jgi:SAM-dependent methyltransferase